MNEALIFNITNKLLLLHLVIDTFIKLLQMALNINDVKMQYFYWLLIFKFFTLISNYKFLIHDSYTQEKREYICIVLYMIEILGQTHFNLASSVDINIGNVYLSGVERVLSLIIVEINVRNLKNRRIFMLVENTLNLGILYVNFMEEDFSKLIIPLIENFLTTLWIVVFDQYYQIKIKEQEQKEFYDQKQKEIQAEIVKPYCEIDQEIDEVKGSNSVKRVYEFEDSPSIHIIQHHSNQLSSFYSSEKFHLRSKSISANISQQKNEEQFMSYKSKSIKNSSKYTPLGNNSSNLVPPSNSDISTFNYFQKVQQQYTQQGICCFTQKYELVYFNLQLQQILGTNEDRESVRDGIWKIRTVLLCEDVQLNNSLHQQQTNDYQDFLQIIKLCQKYSQDNTQTSGSNQQNSERVNPLNAVREKIYEYKKNQYKPNSRFGNGSQDLNLQDLNTSSLKLFPGGFHTFQRIDDKHRSSAFLSNSFVFSMTQRTFKDFPFVSRNISFQQANLTLINIIEFLYLLLDIKLQIWEEFNLLYQPQNKNIKQLDFNLITTFAKDNKILEVKISHIFQGNQNLLFLEVNDITDHYLLRLSKLQTEVLSWQKNYNTNCIKSFINGFIPLVEIGLKSKTNYESNIFFRKIDSFCNTYCLNLFESEFQNFMPKKYGLQAIQQFEVINLCEDLRTDIFNIYKYMNINLDIKQCDTPVICSDPNKIRMIIWNILQIMYKLFSQPTITITINQQDIQIHFMIDGKGILDDLQLFDLINKSTDANLSSQASRSFTGSPKETRFTFIIQKCQSIALELSLYQHDLMLANLTMDSDRPLQKFQIKFTVTNQNPDQSEINFSARNFNQYQFSSKFQITPKFNHNVQYYTKILTIKKIMIYDSNGSERFSLEQQLDFLIIKYKFVFTSNNIKEEINKEIQSIGFNPYPIIMIIIDPFDEFNYRELNYELKDEYSVKTLAISWRKMEKDEVERLGFDDSLEKPILLNDIYRLWSQYMQIQSEDLLQNPQ